jgi:hypothetical protein
MACERKLYQSQMDKLLSVSVHLSADVACCKFYFTAERSEILRIFSKKKTQSEITLSWFYHSFILFCFICPSLYRIMAFLGQCV